MAGLKQQVPELSSQGSRFALTGLCSGQKLRRKRTASVQVVVHGGQGDHEHTEGKPMGSSWREAYVGRRFHIRALVRTQWPLYARLWKANANALCALAANALTGFLGCRDMDWGMLLFFVAAVYLTVASCFGAIFYYIVVMRQISASHDVVLENAQS